MSIPNGITPIPMLSGLALLQFGAAGDEWTGYVGLFSVVAVAVVVVLSKLGLLKTVGGNAGAVTPEQAAQLSKSLDELGRKVEHLDQTLTSKIGQLEATVTSQVRILGYVTDELKEATRQAAASLQWMKVQKELETERRLRRGEAG